MAWPSFRIATPGFKINETDKYRVFWLHGSKVDAVEGSGAGFAVVAVGVFVFFFVVFVGVFVGVFAEGKEGVFDGAWADGDFHVYVL